MTIKRLVLWLILITIFGIVIAAQILISGLSESKQQVSKGKEFGLQAIITPPAAEPLKNPIDLAVSSVGEIYVTDSDNHRIQVFDPDGGFLFRFGKYGKGDGELQYPVAVVTDKKDNVYVADLNNHRISVFTSKGRFKYHIQVTRDGGIKSIPTAMAIDRDGYLYIIDKADNTVKKLTRNGEVLLVFGRLGTGDGELRYPLGIDVGKDGTIYVSDTGNNRIQIFGANGVLSRVIRIPIGPPSGIAVDKAGRVYYTEPTNGTLTVLSPQDDSRIVLAGNGDTENVDLFFPEGLQAVGEKLYVTDKGTNQIFIYQIEKE